MVGIVNSPHTRRMTPLRTRISTALFQFSLSHRPLVFVFEALWGTIVTLISLVIMRLELVDFFSLDTIIMIHYHASLEC